MLRNKEAKRSALILISNRKNQNFKLDSGMTPAVRHVMASREDREAGKALY